MEKERGEKKRAEKKDILVTEGRVEETEDRIHNNKKGRGFKVGVRNRR